jgi:hypothetical protein
MKLVRILDSVWIEDSLPGFMHKKPRRIGRGLWQSRLTCFQRPGSIRWVIGGSHHPLELRVQPGPNSLVCG